MGIDRRTFLQRAGLGLLTLGISETGLFFLGNSPRLARYYYTLAQPTARKLALLVGINQYPAIRLNGCVTDVELQRELLIYRFGFLPEDILILKDAGATRTLIETAIDEHLVAQAKAGDVVVFHFSGYGSQVKVGECPANSLVPIDGISEDPNLAVQNPILLDTLTLLGRSLATDKVTMVLDTSYGNTDQLLRGNLRVRSCPRSAAELTNSDTLGRLPRGEHPGIILAAAGGDEVATEVRWNGFSAGLFTSALTQVLWQSTERSTVRTIINRTTEAVEVIMGQQQQPNLLGGEGKTLSPYYLPPLPNTSAAGIITAVENDTVELQLLGLPATVLSNYGLNSCFMLPSPRDEVQLQILSREGMKAKGRLTTLQSSTSLEVGQLVRESIRVLPSNVSLTVALDSDLTRIERVDATSAFSSISFVSSLIAASDQAADFLLGRTKENLTGNGWGNEGGYRLYSVGGVPIPNTAGVAFEAVKSAIERLRSKLETLLAAKLWRLTVNEGSSRLSVSVTLESIGQGNIQTVMQRATDSWVRSQSSSVGEDQNPVPSIRIGSKIQYRLSNFGHGPIYVMAMGLRTGGNPIVLYLPEVNNSDLFPGETFIFPELSSSFSWVVTGPVGVAELQIICSRSPFNNTFEALKSQGYFFGERKAAVKLSNPLSIAHALLQDLHDASQVSATITGSSFDVYALDVNAWATFSVIYQVV